MNTNYSKRHKFSKRRGFKIDVVPLPRVIAVGCGVQRPKVALHRFLRIFARTALYFYICSRLEEKGQFIK